jgi:hypothetical protein
LTLKYNAGTEVDYPKGAKLKNAKTNIWEEIAMSLPVRRLCLVVTLLALLSACSKEAQQTQSVTTKTDSGTSTAPPAKEVDQRNNALVRVINTVPGNPALDLYADDQKIFGPISFKMVTPYKELGERQIAFRVRTMGQDRSQPLAERSETLSGGRHYTVLVMPDTNDRISLRVINDNLEPTSADKAEIRVIHASPDAGDVDLVAKQNNSKLFSSVGMGTNTSYSDVDPMNGNLEVRAEGQEKALATVPNSKLDKGRMYTIVVAGKLNGAPKLEAIVIEDQVGTIATASAD